MCLHGTVHMRLLLKGDCITTASELGSCPPTIKVTGEPGPPGEGVEGKQVTAL